MCLIYVIYVSYMFHIYVCGCSEASAEEEERVQSIRSRLGDNTTLIAVEAGIVLLSSGPR